MHDLGVSNLFRSIGRRSVAQLGSRRPSSFPFRPVLTYNPLGRQFDVQSRLCFACTTASCHVYSTHCLLGSCEQQGWPSGALSIYSFMDPDVPRVKLRAPSDSPPPRIRLCKPTAHDEASEVDISTPRRRNRAPFLRQKPSRKAVPKANLPQHSHHSEPHTEPFSDTPSLQYVSNSPVPIQSPSSHDEYSSFPMDTDCLYPQSSEEDSYESFVEAVLAQVCSVYQLTQRMFLVNGWNSISKTPTVC